MRGAGERERRRMGEHRITKREEAILFIGLLRAQILKKGQKNSTPSGVVTSFRGT